MCIYLSGIKIAPRNGDAVEDRKMKQELTQFEAMVDWTGQLTLLALGLAAAVALVLIG